MKVRTLPLFLLSALSGGLAKADSVDFVRDIRPIFESRCYSCHGTEKQKGGLRLDVKAAALKGGEDHAPNIVPGKSKESPLIKFVKGEEEDLVMPPKGKRLTTEQIALLARWIEEGANWPDGVDAAKVEDRREHWSLHPVNDPAPPATQNTGWARSAIDRFILERLEKEGLSPSPEADRAAWLRRVSFDLTGLPPSPEEMQAFLKDHASNAHERVVDGLLKSPRYGERWGQHWLDVVRYADTHGFEVNTERPNAWPYRDYVIRALNNDTPYDQFVRDQIAGDATGQDSATGFLVTASVLLPGQIGRDDASKRLARQDAIDEIVVNTSQTFLGLSVGCARCHDHKFDAISARDYYAMQAFFAGVEYQDRELRTPEAQAAKKEARIVSGKIAEIDKKLAAFVPMAKAGAKRPAVNAKVNTDRFPPIKAKRVRFSIQKTNNLEPCIDELEVFNTEGVNVALLLSGARVSASGQTIVADRHDLNYINDGRYGNSRSWMGNENGKGSVVVEFPTVQTIDRVVWGRDRDGKFQDRLATGYQIEICESGEDWLLVADSSDRATTTGKDAKAGGFSMEGLTPDEVQQARALVSQKQPLSNHLTALNSAQKAFAGVFRAPDDIHLLYRGNPEQPKEPVSPAVLSVLGDLKLPAAITEQDRRVALAAWISDAKNPLTARVMVNRIWQGHFGTGIVATPSDFGRMGLRPSHPELLDWLAREFVRNGWSMKSLHKQIVLSATYRQSSAYNGTAAAKDAESRLLWRFPPRRLEAESLRDTILAVSGELNVKMYGKGFDFFNQRGGLSGFNPVEKFTGDGLRRMIYAHKVRREPEAVFGAFDCPDAGLSTSRRSESTTPIQALNLLNSRFVLDQSEAFAVRLKREAGDDPGSQIQRAYLLAVGRLPDAEEHSDALSVVATHGAAALCRAILNSNEFVFVP
jgi:mono/diheme cytochrome c family protein